LRHARSVADIDEQKTTEIPYPMHPPKEDDIFPDIAGTEIATGVGARKLAELFSHVV
jgi:hypothetical protein